MLGDGDAIASIGRPFRNLVKQDQVALPLACADMMVAAGVDPRNILMTDSKGVLYEGREPSWNETKARYVRRTKARTLGDALKGADVFVGVSQANLVTPAMVKSMGRAPILFAMANPDPEILPAKAKEARPRRIPVGRPS